ncbi:MAG: YdcF family protein [Lachnospiraceae bacterium]|nr:YdcF family protein [Lachnospiraceae bacterium]
MIKTIMTVVSLLIVLLGLGLAYLLLRKIKKKGFFHRFRICVYLPLALWSGVYFIVCVIYAGLFLSWIWLWPLAAIFCTARVFMLRAELAGTARFRIPRPLRVIYYSIFTVGLLFFLFVEGRIVDAMTSEPPEDLDYVIVLGAGLIGTEPKNPLRVRIERGAEYMKENPRTILVASGGQGADEEISEAEAIRRRLTGMYGIDEGRILMEDRSRDTEENLQNSLRIIGDPEASVGIITNSFHEYRAMLLAKHAGFKNTCTVPATTLLPVGVHYMVREFFGVVECMIKYGSI